MKVADIVKTRFMKPGDLDRIIEINYNNNMKDGEELLDLVQQRWTVGMVAVDQEDYPLGFCIYSLDHQEYYDVKHLVVDKIYHRLGIGTQIINRMKGKVNSDRNFIVFNVSEDNLACQLFLRKMGFRSKLVRHVDGDIIRFFYKGDK